MGLMPGVKPTELASSGWAVIFPETTEPGIKEALAPLLKRRKAQAKALYREYTGEDGYWLGESKAEFLARHGAGPGPVHPKRMPYYLLLVGGLETIPLQAQYEFGVQYAVGRIAFDTVEEYARYASNVVDVETDSRMQARRAGFFGVQNPDDRGTRHILEYLTRPLMRMLSEGRPDWQIDAYLVEAATKAQLGNLMGGEDRPTLLFTSSHGMRFRPGDKRQRAHSGALLCQNWPGPKAWGVRRIPKDQYFSGADVSDSADLRGMITFHFGSFGAAVPEESLVAEMSEVLSPAQRKLADRPFLARLPQRLLGHPRGSLAFVGHADNAWGFSYYWPGSKSQPDPFGATLSCLMEGEPVGHAMRYFGDRHGQLMAELHGRFYEERGRERSREYLDLLTASNDARSYIVLGDPAVRLRVACD